MVFFDGILIYSKTWEDLLKHIDEVLGILEQQPFYPKASKYEFGTEILYLGLKISAQGVSVVEEKIKTIQDWPRTRKFTHLRGFVGVCRRYKRFVKGFSQLAAPLKNLMKGAFSWSPST